jgi:alkanesulfonate monooxygenase SsuD/methylene tetrahydromethanopterin reductase-like flavin-dependent oxidoreductase (luciferase family)
MKFGVWVPNVGSFGDVDAMVELARAAESSGWDGFFIWDMLTPELAPDGPPMVIDPFVTLAAVAFATDRIALGPMITPVARRRVQKLARETVTLDRLACGRLILGVGLGDRATVEFEAFGEEPDARVRAQKLDEGLEVLAGLWSGQPVTFRGGHLKVTDVAFLPQPIQQPRIPIWVAGHWPVKPPMERAARWDGAFPLGADVLSSADHRAIAEFIARHRRDDRPFDVVHAESPREGSVDTRRISEYAASGVTWWLCMFMPGDGVEAAVACASHPPGSSA